jgi:hypothetical protein
MKKTRWLLTAGWLLSLPLFAGAMPPITPRHLEEYELHTGLHDGAAAGDVVAFRDTVRAADDAPWMRLHFADYNLGAESYVILTSLDNGDWQRLDARSMIHWNRATGIFRGGAVELELHVAPADTGVFIDVGALTVGERREPDGGVASICDSGDERVVSGDNRVGRLYFGGCTAWLTSNGAVLTAGHCVDFDPDATPGNCGPLLPDGVLDLNGVVEFNVPLSQANGNINPALLVDQYPIDLTSVSWRFDGCGQGLGKDYAVFGVNPNSTTGLTAHQAQGFLRMTREAPAVDATIRVTGCGADSDTNTRNLALQTDTGTYEGESSSGADFSHNHRADTEGASSGSPIIWEANGLTIGIHTNAGCTSSGGSNSGTSFEHTALETALEGFPGFGAVYVDRGHALPVDDNGTIFRPYNTIPEAIADVPNGGIISIVEGIYPASEGNTFLIGDDGRAMWLRAPVGSVLIGD